MGFDTLLRAGVGIANTLTASLQETVSHEAFVSQDEWSTPTYSTAVSRTAIVERKQRMVRNSDGREILATMTLTFVGDVNISVNDRITVNGETAPVIAVEGPVDPTTGRGFVTTVSLGEQGSVR